MYSILTTSQSHRYEFGIHIDYASTYIKSYHISLLQNASFFLGGWPKNRRAKIFIFCQPRWPTIYVSSAVPTSVVPLLPSLGWEDGPPKVSGFKYFWNFHPDPWGDDPIWRAYFSNGLVQPPTSQDFPFQISGIPRFLDVPRSLVGLGSCQLNRDLATTHLVTLSWLIDSNSINICARKVQVTLNQPMEMCGTRPSCHSLACPDVAVQLMELLGWIFGRQTANLW